MKVLLVISGVFAPKTSSLYSSQTESKRELKQQALVEATIGNLNGIAALIHASLEIESQSSIGNYQGIKALI